MICENGNYRDLTQAEITAKEHAAKVAAAGENSRPLTEAEAIRLLLTQQINTVAVDDNTALRLLVFYPSFESLEGQMLGKGYRFTFGGKLWRVIQPSLTIQAHYAPGIGTESLYEQICESHAGTEDDPVAYHGNMTLDEGKYYFENGAMYVCTRSSGQPVYDALADLVGLFVEVY